MKKLLVVILMMSLIIGVLSAQEKAFFVENNESETIRETSQFMESLDGTRNNSIFFEGFESATFPPTGWTMQNANDLSAWRRMTAESFNPPVEDLIKTGLGAAGSFSWNGSPSNPNNYLITPQITIPNADGEVQLKFWRRSNGNPEWSSEQYTIYVSTAGNQVSNFTTVVFNETIAPTAAAYEEKTVSLTAYKGQNIWLAFRHHDCNDNNYLVIDDIEILGGGGDPPDPNLLPPVNLQAGVDGSTVNLTWDAPGASQWISHVTATAAASNIGVAAAAEMTLVHRFSEAQLASLGVQGGSLATVAFMTGNSVTLLSAHVRVYTGGSGSTGTPIVLTPGTMVVDQEVPLSSLSQGGVGNTTWNEISLTSPVTIPTSGEMWIGVHYSTSTGHPGAADGTSVNGPLYGYGNAMSWGGTWQTLVEASGGSLFNMWMIKGFVQGATGMVAIGYDDETSSVGTRSLQGYNVRRNTTLLTPTPITDTSFSNTNVPEGGYMYHVSAVYTTGESVPASVEVQVLESVIFRENFDATTFPPAGWTMIDADGDGRNWVRWTSTNHNNSPGSAASESSYNSGGDWLPLTPDNYLITPAIAIPPSSPDVDNSLFFFVGTPSPDFPTDRYQVLVSTSTPTIPNFQVIHDETLNGSTAAWSERIIDLSDYDNQTIHIAFRHFNSVDMHLVRIDDVLVKGFSEVTAHPPRNLTATGGNNSVTLNWDPPIEGSPAQYRIYKKENAIATISASQTTYTENMLVNGLTYQYSVSALYVSPSNESAKAGPVDGKPEGETIFPFAPKNLEATQEDSNVTLTWEEPEYFLPIPPGATDFYHPWPEANYSGVGMGGANPYTVGNAQRFSPQHLQAFGIGAGWKLVGVDWWGGNLNSTGTAYTIAVFTGGTSKTDHGTLAHEQFWGVTDSETVSTNIMTGLTSYIDIPSGQELRIRIMATAPPSSHAICFGTDPNAVAGYGNLLFMNNTYEEVNLVTNLENILGNSMIGGWAMSPSGHIVRLGSSSDGNIPPEIRDKIDAISRVDYTKMAAENTSAEGTLRGMQTRNFMHYNVYHNDAPVTPSGTTDLSIYIPDIIDGGMRRFEVSAYYQGVGESERVTLNYNVAPRVFIDEFFHYEEFDATTFPPRGWFNYDEDGDGRSWIRTTQIPHQGPGAAASISRLPAGPITPDNWLVTPRIIVPSLSGEQKFGIRYYVSGHDVANYAEQYEVRVSEASPAVADFTALIHKETLSQSDWDLRVHDLSAYAGKTILIAFRHLHEAGTGQGTFKIDSIRLGDHTDANDEPIVARTQLHGNYPNPFNPETAINFSIGNEGHVSIDIYNIRGQKVRTLVNDVYGIGDHKAIWNGHDDNGREVGSGVYFYQMKSEGTTATRRMVLMK